MIAEAKCWVLGGHDQFYFYECLDVPILRNDGKYSSRHRKIFMICSLKCVRRYFHEVKFTYCNKIHSFDQMGCYGQNAWRWPPGLPVPGSETQKSFTIIGPQSSLLKKCVRHLPLRIKWNNWQRVSIHCNLLDNFWFHYSLKYSPILSELFSES